MKKIKIFIGILIIGIALISGCIEPELDVSDESKISECKSIANQRDRCSCYRMIAINTGNPSICDKVEIQELRDGCYTDIAINTTNPSICDKVEIQYKRDWCYAITNAIIKGDASFCEKLSQHSRKWCYESVIIKTNDPSICKKIEDQGERDRCYSIVTQRIRHHVIISIRDAANFLWVHGYPSKINVHITLPKGVREFSINNHAIILRLETTPEDLVKIEIERE